LATTEGISEIPFSVDEDALLPSFFNSVLVTFYFLFLCVGKNEKKSVINIKFWATIIF